MKMGDPLAVADATARPMAFGLGGTLGTPVAGAPDHPGKAAPARTAGKDWGEDVSAAFFEWADSEVLRNSGS
jgi:hypothetical protein